MSTIIAQVCDVCSLKEVAEYVRKLLPGADITMLPGTFTSDPVKFDTKLIEEEIGYHPQWSMEGGIKETVNMVRREYDLSLI